MQDQKEGEGVSGNISDSLNYKKFLTYTDYHGAIKLELETTDLQIKTIFHWIRSRKKKNTQQGMKRTLWIKWVWSMYALDLGSP